MEEREEFWMEALQKKYTVHYYSSDGSHFLMEAARMTIAESL